MTILGGVFLKTDLQKYKDFFDEMGIKYSVKKDSEYLVREHSKEDYWELHERRTDAIIIHIDDEHFVFNHDPEIRAIFNSVDESFIAFEAWGE